MKKVWLWIAALLGAPALCFGLLALDSTSRAVASIQAHDARLVADIAAQRAKRKAGPAPAPLPGRSLFRNSAEAVLAYEQGHPAQQLLSNRIDWGFVPDPGDPGTLARSMALIQSTLAEGGYVAFHARTALENIVLGNLGRLLEKESVDPGELRKATLELNHLMAGRPSAPDVVAGEQLLDRTETLNVLHLKRDPHCMIFREPGWKEFFSWRILIAKSLNQLDDHLREALELESLPAAEQDRLTTQWAFLGEIPKVHTRSSLRTGAQDIYLREHVSLAHWRMIQIATAIALFRREKKGFPATLDELVPDYLPAIPVTPPNGHSVTYVDRTLRISGTQFHWPSKSAQK